MYWEGQPAGEAVRLERVESWKSKVSSGKRAAGSAM